MERMAVDLTEEVALLGELINELVPRLPSLATSSAQAIMIN